MMRSSYSRVALAISTDGLDRTAVALLAEYRGPNSRVVQTPSYEVYMYQHAPLDRNYGSAKACTEYHEIDKYSPALSIGLLNYLLQGQHCRLKVVLR